MSFQTVAYVRVSSVDQHTDRQTAAIGAVDRIFTDHLSGGSRQERAALGEMLDYIREGDTVRVASMDRLARSVIDLAQLVAQCTDKGVSVEFVEEHLTFTKDEANPYAMFQLHMLGAVAQLERSLIRERQRQGIAIARTKSTYKGRLPVLSTEQIATARASLALKVPKAQIARDLGVSRSALYDALASRGAYVRPSTTSTTATTTTGTAADPAPSPRTEEPADPTRTPHQVDVMAQAPATTALDPGPRAALTFVAEPPPDRPASPTEPATKPTRSGEHQLARELLGSSAASSTSTRRQTTPPAQTTTTTPQTMPPAAKKPRAGRKRWFVVEVAATDADNANAEVVIMSTHTTKASAERARGRLQVKARSDHTRDDVITVRGENQIHRYRTWDHELGRGVTKHGPPPR